MEGSTSTLTSQQWRLYSVPSIEHVDCQDIHACNEDNSEDYSLTTTSVKGVAYPFWCNETRWQRLDEQTTYRAGDIIVVSYPKCGTTWSEQTILLLANNGHPDLLNPKTKNSFEKGSNKPGKIWIESMVEQDPSLEAKGFGQEFAALSFEEFNAAPSPRLIKSHAAVPILLGCHGQGLSALPDGVKVVVVVRNPLDACVSAFYHFGTRNKWSFDAFAHLWLAGQSMFGDYFEWVKGWHDDIQRHPDKAIWIQYEDMKRDARGEVLRLANYLDMNTKDDELLNRVMHYSTIDHMKKQAEEQGGDTAGHLRKGVTGDWKNHFSAELHEKFMQKYREVFADSDLKLSFN